MGTLKSTMISLLLIVIMIAPLTLAESVSVLMQEGLYAEEIEGDLDAAIKIYEQIAAEPGPDKRIAAHAAYRIGVCYLKMGRQSQAVEQFQAVVSLFPGQTAVAAKAREQLRDLGAAQVSGSTRTSVPAAYPLKGGGTSIAEVVPPGLQSSLVLYYSFHTDRDPQTVIDISGKGNHGKVHGAAYTTDSALGGAMLFDGGGGYVSMPDINLGAFSFSAWVMTSTRDLNNRRIFLLDAGDDNYYALQGNAGGGVGIYVTGNIEINEYDWKFATGKWTHITVSFDGSRINICINGTLAETGHGSFSQTTTGKAYLGFSGRIDDEDRHDGDECWYGKIDEVALFNRGLTAEEATELFNMTGRADETVDTGELTGTTGLTDRIVATGSAQASKHIITNDFTGLLAYPADIDGDGDLDVVGAARSAQSKQLGQSSHMRSTTSTSTDRQSAGIPTARSGRTRPFRSGLTLETLSPPSSGESDIVYWWENTDRKGTAWTAHVVDANFGGAMNAYPVDIDGDGDIDIIGSDHGAHDIVWWENTAGNGTAWLKHPVEPHSDRVQLVHAADMDRDGDMDIVGATYLGYGIAWWENVSRNGAAWKKHTVDERFYRTHSMWVADINGDGRFDIVASAGRESGVNWWQNPSVADGDWTRHYVIGSDGEVESVYPSDIDADGDVDIVGSIRRVDGLTWWENANSVGTDWTKHVVDASYSDEQHVDISDMDGDGDLDILAAARRIDSVIWWENTDAKAMVWAKHIISNGFGNASWVYAADMDRDGDMDILGAAGDKAELAWFENDSETFKAADQPVAWPAASTGL